MTIRIAIILIACITFLGCDNMTEKKNPANEAVHTELGILPKLIALPKQPISVIWKLTENQERGQGCLSAVLKFKESDYTYIIENSQPFEKKSNAKISIEIYDKLFPDDAKAGISVKPTGKLYEIIGIQPVQPNLFADADISQYIRGDITPLKNGYIYLELASM